MIGFPVGVTPVSTHIVPIGLGELQKKERKNIEGGMRVRGKRAQEELKLWSRC